MTLWGKILTVLNLGMSFFFMAFALAVHVARQDLTGKLATAGKQIESIQTDSAKLAAEKEAAEKQLTAQVNEKEGERARLEKEVAKLTGDLEAASKDAKTSQEQGGQKDQLNQNMTNEVAQRRGEVNTVRTQLQEQLEKYDGVASENTKLKDQLAEKTNEAELLNAKNQELNAQLAQYDAFIKSKGFDPRSAEVAEAEPTDVPPDVEGVITKVDETGRFVLISIGEDDGIRRGHELEVWRTKPEPKYVAKIKVQTTQPDQAVALPVTVTGPILPNDRVGPRIIVR